MGQSFEDWFACEDHHIFTNDKGSPFQRASLFSLSAAAWIRTAEAR
jgi:hypothetical protein